MDVVVMVVSVVMGVCRERGRNVADGGEGLMEMQSRPREKFVKSGKALRSANSSGRILLVAGSRHVPYVGCRRQRAKGAESSPLLFDLRHQFKQVSVSSCTLDFTRALTNHHGPNKKTAAFDSPRPHPPVLSSIMERRLWVRRPGASATLVHIRDDDLVDDARETILVKYANSLSRTFDAPDVTLNILEPLEQGQQQRYDRILRPDEPICRVIDTVYPHGQTVDDALVIHVPLSSPAQRAPALSPGGARAYQDYRPKSRRQNRSSPSMAAQPSGSNVAARDHPSHVYPFPSHSVSARPRSFQLSMRPRIDSPLLEHSGSDGAEDVAARSTPPLLPVPQSPECVPRSSSRNAKLAASYIPPAMLRANSARPGSSRKSTAPQSNDEVPRQRSKLRVDDPILAESSRDGPLIDSVPAINVLIVEDNYITLRYLQHLMKTLKVRFDSATNGQIAVDKWKLGGFHLVLMDIQMDVMDGIAATKEIRRLEKFNGIGAFSNHVLPSDEQVPTARDGESSQADDDPPGEEDRLAGGEGFKSPVIIVALTASSLESDRHAALAAGCNDFVTKPVDSGWLQRKVKEWGCMQALIDFDGWKSWKAE